MSTPKSEAPETAPISDFELAAVLENSPWAMMEREAQELPTTSLEEAA